jgi:hypothetical protein
VLKINNLANMIKYRGRAIAEARNMSGNNSGKTSPARATEQVKDVAGT